MKRSIKSFAKKASNLYQSIHRQLSVYAGAAVVAVVSVLALTQPSEAKIVYTPVNIGIGANQKYNLDLNHDGVTDFTIQYYSSWTNRCSFFSDLSLQPASSNRVVYAADGLFGVFAAALGRAIPIGRSSGFSEGGQGQTMADFHARVPDCFLAADGPWVNAVDRYLGLSFQKNGHTHYGWAKLNVQLHSFHDWCESEYSCYFIATLTGYAYETIAGKSIKAGQKKEATDQSSDENFGPGASLTNPIPDTLQPTSLGMLALGAQGVPLSRRKESALERDLKRAS
jgi:hypothetical protein